jgi:hypothetical protein
MGMKKLLATLLCIGALIGLPGCGCCKKSCDSYENRMECHDEMQEDGTVKRICSDGNVITVYEGAGVDGKRGKGRKEGGGVRHNVKVVNPTLPEGTPLEFCDKNQEQNLQYWQEVATEEVKPQKRAPRGRSRRSEEKEMMEMQ